MITHYEKYKAVSEKFGISTELAKDICEAQFKYLKNLILERDRGRYYMLGLGFFEIPSKNIYSLNNYEKKHKERLSKLQRRKEPL